MRWAGLKASADKQDSEARRGAKSWWKGIAGGVEAADPSTVVCQPDGTLILRADSPATLRRPNDDATETDNGQDRKDRSGGGGELQTGCPTPPAQGRSEVARAPAAHPPSRESEARSPGSAEERQPGNTPPTVPSARHRQPNSSRPLCPLRAARGVARELVLRLAARPAAPPSRPAEATHSARARGGPSLAARSAKELLRRAGAL